MKKILFLLFLGYALNVNAQLTGLIDSNKSNSYYYTKGIEKVFFKSPRTLIKNTPMPVSTKANDFTVVAEEYGKDKQNIFWGNKKLLNGDISTFGWNHKAELPFDKDFMYEGIPNKDKLVPIENIDKNSYERVKLDAECLIWHKDINYYYYNHKVTTAKRQKLSFESEYLPFDDAYIFMIDGKDWEPYRYIGNVRVVANNIVYDDQYVIISGICGEKRSKLNKIEIDDATQLIFDIEDKSVDVLYSDLVFKTGKYILYKGKYLYLSKKEDITDLSQFKELYKDYYQYIEKVYYAEKELIEIIGADSHTFELLKEGYSKDVKQVYHLGKLIVGADAKTFEIRYLQQLAWDQNNVYKEGEIISTDAPNYQILSPNYSKDRFKVYHDFKEMLGVDTRTFKHIISQYAKDKNNVYYQGKIIEGADSKTFKSISNSHAKDKNHVYYWGKILKGYEPSKFVKDKCGRLPDSSNYGERCPTSSSSRRSRWSSWDD